MTKSKICSGCRFLSDDNDPDVGPADAEFRVQGQRYDSVSDRWVPYRANLCGDHLLLLEDDGFKGQITPIRNV